MIDYKQTDFGFEYGPVEVTRITSDQRKGWVIIEIKTAKTTIELYITKTGDIKVDLWKPANLKVFQKS